MKEIANISGVRYKQVWLAETKGIDNHIHVGNFAVLRTLTR